MNTPFSETRMDRNDLLRQLSIYPFQAIFEAEEPLHLPTYKGSTFRGAFGHAFQQTGCMCYPKPSQGAPHTLGCPYGEVFEGAGAEANPLWSFEQIPRPFLLEPPSEAKQQFEAGDKLVLGFTLFGHAIQHLPFIVLALEQMGQSGIGSGKRKITLRQIFTIDEQRDFLDCIYSHRDQKLQSNSIQPLSVNNWFTSKPVGANASSMEEAASGSAEDIISRVTVRFVTPARFKHGGALSDSPEFPILFGSICRRIASLLAYHHNVAITDMSPFRPLLSQAKAISLIVDHTHWSEFERYSNRQKSHLKMGGIVGKASYEGPLAPFLPWLIAAEWTAAGKNPVFGLGQIRLQY